MGASLCGAERPSPPCYLQVGMRQPGRWRRPGAAPRRPGQPAAPPLVGRRGAGKWGGAAGRRRVQGEAPAGRANRVQFPEMAAAPQQRAVRLLAALLAVHAFLAVAGKSCLPHSSCGMPVSTRYQRVAFHLSCSAAARSPLPPLPTHPPTHPPPSHSYLRHMFGGGMRLLDTDSGVTGAFDLPSKARQGWGARGVHQCRGRESSGCRVRRHKLPCSCPARACLPLDVPPCFTLAARAPLTLTPAGPGFGGASTVRVRYLLGCGHLRDAGRGGVDGRDVLRSHAGWAGWVGSPAPTGSLCSSAGSPAAA